MTTQQLAAMKLALEALKWANKEINEWREDAYGYDAKDQPTIMSAVNAINEALAQPEQEPVAWMSSGEARMIHWKSKHPGFGDDWIPLYTIPPHRNPLTDEVISALWSWSQSSQAEATANTQQHAFARSIEAAHGIWPENSDCYGPDWTDRDGEYLK